MKIWLCSLISQNASLEHVQEMLDDVWDKFEGLVFCYHGELGSLAHQHLESRKGNGKIIHLPWYNHFAFQMNHFLNYGPMGHGDWFIHHDLDEKLKPYLLENMEELFNRFDSHDVDGALMYGKTFAYRFHDGLQFAGNPHTYMTGTNGKLVDIVDIYREKYGEEWIKENLFENLRPKRRLDEFHFVRHFANYYIAFPETQDFNHMLMGLEQNYSNPQEIRIKANEREQLRREFRSVLRKHHGVELTVDAVVEAFKAHPKRYLDYINKEKILNDLFRHEVLRDSSVTSSHKFEDMVEITEDVL